MLRLSIKNNIKTIIRDPSTLLAILAALIMEIMYGINIQYGDVYGNIWGKDLYLTEVAFERILNTMMNLVGNPLSNIVFVFMGVVVAAIFAALAHLVMKAADLQEQYDLTI